MCTIREENIGGGSYINYVEYNGQIYSCFAKQGDFITGKQIQTYNALEKASYKIGWNNYQKQLKGRKKIKQVIVSEEQNKLIQAMPKVLSGELKCEEAMALLHGYDNLKERFGE